MSKRSLGRYHSASFKMPDLRRADLAKIEAVIREELRPKRYHIDCQGFEYDGVDDIPADSGRPASLVILTHAPCMRLKLARSWAELYCEELEDRNSSVVRKISEIVRRRERPLLWRFCKYSIWLAPMVGFGGLCEAVILMSTGTLGRSGPYVGLGILALAYLWWVACYRVHLFRFSRITLHEA